jgi:CBS domain-containing protein
MMEVGHTLEDVPARMEFDHAQANLYAAARDGLSARFTWLDGEEVLAQPLILDRLLPMARAGLDRAGTDPADSSRYLGIIEQRVRTLRTGSRWMLTSLAGMKDRSGTGERLTALTAAILARQKTARVVSEWERASLDEVSGDKSGYYRVAQFMTTDIFTVQADDPVELVADMISWRRIQHVPVEDARGQLVGLVTYRAVMRHLAERAKGAGVGTRDPRGTSVTEIMKTQVITVSPDTTTLQAVALMRQHGVGCLPVVQDGHLVGMITEDDFMGIASDLFRQGLAEAK